MTAHIAGSAEEILLQLLSCRAIRYARNTSLKPT